ncbi:MAG: limonene-1,2-epoxide hydrolase family protein [Actinomycetota bacterium]
MSETDSSTAPIDIVSRFIQLINDRNLDAAVALCASDVEYDNVPMGKNIGREATREFLAPMLGGLDDVEFIVHREAATGNIVMNERTDRFIKNGTTADIPVVGVFELNESGEIALWRDYFDMGAVDALMQLLRSS